jgi:GNAT superfamily N-acetyltransferase
MPEKVELYLYTKGECAAGRIPSHWKDPEKFIEMPPHHRVMAVENPLSKSDGDPVRAYVLVDDHVAGRVGLVMQEVTVSGERLPVLWGFDLIVSPKFRGRGLAIKLVEAWQNAHHTALGTHVNIPSIGIYRKLGWSDFHTPSYFNVYRSRRFVDGYLPGAGALAGPLVDAGLALRRAFRRLGGGVAARGLRTEVIDSMSSEFDDAMARQSAAIVTHRSAEWVNWMLRVGRADEHRAYRLCYVLDDRDETVGYYLLQRKRITLRGRFKNVAMGLLRDWYAFAEGKVDTPSIVGLALREAIDWDSEAVMVTIPDWEGAEGLRRSRNTPEPADLGGVQGPTGVASHAGGSRRAVHLAASS